MPIASYISPLSEKMREYAMRLQDSEEEIWSERQREMRRTICKPKCFVVFIFDKVTMFYIICAQYQYESSKGHIEMSNSAKDRQEVVWTDDCSPLAVSRSPKRSRNKWSPVTLLYSRPRGQ